MRIKCRTGAGDEPVELYIADGRFAPRPEVFPPQACDLGGEDLRVAPGLIDIQINGYDGVDFNDPDTGAEQIAAAPRKLWRAGVTDRKSTRLNSSHLGISYAVFCLKKKNKILSHITIAPTTNT